MQPQPFMQVAEIEHTVLVFLHLLSWEDLLPIILSASSQQIVLPFALMFSFPGAKLSLDATGYTIPRVDYRSIG